MIKAGTTVSIIAMVFLFGCTSSKSGGADGGAPDSGLHDGGVQDAGADGGIDDGGDQDSGLPDAGEPDAGADAGFEDAGETDAGVPDAGPTALFGYSNQNEWISTQQVTDDGLEQEISYGTWNEIYNTMTGLNVGDASYLMGHNTGTGSWFINNILQSGDMGPETEHGVWLSHANVLISFQVGAGTYIYRQNEKTKYWYMQEILPGGTIGLSTSNGQWSHFFPKTISFHVGTNTYIMGQEDDTYTWFIRRVYPDGTIGSETDHGTLDDYYDTLASFQAGGKTFIMGQESEGYTWFIRRILPGGVLGEVTDSGSWIYFYDTAVPYTIGGNTYAFLQSKDGHNWAIRKIESGGHVGAELSSGYWGYYFSYVFPFGFDDSFLDMSDWMQKNWPLISGRKLSRIVMPGSHDAGMGMIQKCFTGARECNTRTQKDIIETQLWNGSRYFDVRPVRNGTGSGWNLGHFSWAGIIPLGCLGEDLQDVMQGVKSFVQEKSGELVILKFSHCGDLLDLHDGCDAALIQEYWDEVKSILDPVLVKCSGCKLSEMTLAEVLASGNVIALVEGIASDEVNGRFAYREDQPSEDNAFPIYDQYANSDKLDTMIEDQITKLLNPANHYDSLLFQDRFFILSWTLTLQAAEAPFCGSGKYPSIQTLAHQADAVLIPKIYKMALDGEITGDLLPNVLYVDWSDTFSSRLAVLMNRFFYQ